MNKQELNGQTAIVTGGAQGIGFAVAKQLVAGGAKVALLDLDDALMDKAVAQLGKGAIARNGDITDLPRLETIHSEVEAELGPVSILVNSAGIAGSNATVQDYDPAEWRRIVDINLIGTFNVNRVVIPGMIGRNYGRIVNIASIAGKEGNPNASAYSASKAGVIGLTKSIGKELAGHDIAVNCVTPAAARTRIFDQMSQEHIDYMLSKIPRGRFLELDEAAAMICWLASSENSFTTGAVFDLSGGRATY